MSDVTLENITALLKAALEPIIETLAEHTKILTEHTKILSTHTSALDQLLTEKKNRNENKTVKDDRIDYLEKWQSKWVKSSELSLGLN